ncbi:LysR family transcriptional regulator [Bordetella muralis]|jgi:DNA-binding transcriptional LysR family regulator|uniref:LysR family transcriptional regulator n=1 Tax=Bordetella muralis TaxID=1649130 RepID=UPI0039EFD53E
MRSRFLLKPAQMQLLAAIADLNQLQLAAQKIAMSQPAASRMLADIEAAAGGTLFHRHAKGMVPTELGLLVIRRVRALLRELHSLREDIETYHSGGGGEVKIGAVTGPAAGVLVNAVRAFKQTNPGAVITVEVLPSRELVQQLAKGELDFALARLLSEFDSREFDLQPMRDEKIVLLVRASHPLAHQHPASLAELADYEWIMQARGNPIRETVLECFGQLGLSEPANIMNSPSLVFTIAYLRTTDAIVALSEEVAELLTQDDMGNAFAVLPVGGEMRVPPYFLLTLRNRPLSPAAQKLREHVLEASHEVHQASR